MTTTPSPSPAGFGAMPVRSPLYRHRPWVTDSVWVAHESLQLFTRIAALFPHNGWWRLTDTGAEPARSQRVLDLAVFMNTVHAQSVACVVNLDDYQRTPDRDEAMRRSIELTQIVEVLDPTGQVWHFNHDYIEVAALGQPGWSWRITELTGDIPLHSATDQPAAVLVGIDRKDRPRFALHNVHPPA